MNVNEKLAVLTALKKAVDARLKDCLLYTSRCV